MNQAYLDTVRLLLDVAPTVFKSGHFALKGGTALNLFVHEMPRLSVDLDLVVIDHTLDREQALRLIASELSAVQAQLSKKGLRVITPTAAQGDDVKLHVLNGQALVKVEVNHVFRGTAMPVERRKLVTSAEDLFTTELDLPVLALPELYGSKLVAAMDRQHPRDLFDVVHMMRQQGWLARCVDCFVIYLAGHNRPMHEVLFPKLKPLEAAYANEFAGMTREEIGLPLLQAAQRRLVDELPQQLTSKHREFLVSLSLAQPQWDLIDIPHVRSLPAVMWKLANLAKLRKNNPAKLAQQARELSARLAAIG